MSCLFCYSRLRAGIPQVTHPPGHVETSLPPPLAAAHDALTSAESRVREAARQHRAARALLASEIRATAVKSWSVDELVRAAAREMGLKPRTVQNALYETFRLDVFEVCLRLLASRATSRPALTQAA